MGLFFSIPDSFFLSSPHEGMVGFAGMDSRHWDSDSRGGRWWQEEGLCAWECASSGSREVEGASDCITVHSGIESLGDEGEPGDQEGTREWPAGKRSRESLVPWMK